MNMNLGFGSWLIGMSLGAGGGMLGLASGMFGMFIVLAATTFGAALLYAVTGFGFAVLAAPLFLLFTDPAPAIQLVIIISTVLSIVVLRGLLPAIAPWLLLRLALGSLVGLPLGLVAFRYADPFLVRAAAGVMIFGFAILTAGSRRRSGLAAGILIPYAFLGGLAVRPIGDRLGAEAFAKLAIALLAMAGAYTLGAAAVAYATA